MSSTTCPATSSTVRFGTSSRTCNGGLPSSRVRDFQFRAERRKGMSSPYAGLTEYELRHLPAYLGSAKLWPDSLEFLLTDLFFVEAKCAATMTSELVDDYYFVLSDEAPWESQPSLVQFAQFLRSASHLLATSPSLTFQQAANEPDDTAPARFAEQQQQTRQQTRPWLRRLNKTVEVSPCLMSLGESTYGIEACAWSTDRRTVLSVGGGMTIRVPRTQWASCVGGTRSQGVACGR